MCDAIVLDDMEQRWYRVFTRPLLQRLICTKGFLYVQFYVKKYVSREYIQRERIYCTQIYKGRISADHF